MLVCDGVIWSLTGPHFDKYKYDWLLRYRFHVGSPRFSLWLFRPISMTRADAQMEIKWWRTSLIFNLLWSSMSISTEWLISVLFNLAKSSYQSCDVDWSCSSCIVVITLSFTSRGDKFISSSALIKSAAVFLRFNGFFIVFASFISVLFRTGWLCFLEFHLCLVSMVKSVNENTFPFASSWLSGSLASFSSNCWWCSSEFCSKRCFGALVEALNVSICCSGTKLINFGRMSLLTDFSVERQTRSHEKWTFFYELLFYSRCLNCFKWVWCWL